MDVFDSVTRLLGADHDRLDALLVEAKRMLGAGERVRAGACFAEFRGGLERHIVAEEEVLFPEFEALTGIRSGGPTQVMRVEHAEIRRLMAEVASCLERDAEPPTTALAELTALLFAHNGKEERILYPATDRAASTAGRLPGLLHALAAHCPPGTPAATAPTPRAPEVRPG